VFEKHSFGRLGERLCSGFPLVLVRGLEITVRFLGFRSLLRSGLAQQPPERAIEHLSIHTRRWNGQIHSVAIYVESSTVENGVGIVTPFRVGVRVPVAA
jgi:hypothetical protein